MPNLWKHITAIAGQYTAAKNSRGSRVYWLSAIARTARQLADECDALIEGEK